MNFETIKGDTWQGATITLSQSGIPVDITTAEFKMQVRKNACSEIALEWSTSDSTITITEGLSGIFTIAARDIDLTPTTYKFDCEMVLLSVTNTIFSGDWVVTEDITR